MPKKIIPVGERFTRLITISVAPQIGDHTASVCLCDCGKRVIVKNCLLRKGFKKSCGCLEREWKDSITHGMSRTKEYIAYHKAKARCYNPMDEKFKDYGARGIKMCEKWVNSFEAFFDDLGLCPTGLTLDRIDVNGNYEPGNCRWASHLVQQNNKRTNRIISVDGITMTVSQWTRFKGFKTGVIESRLLRGWSERDAISKPLMVYPSP